MAFKPFEKSKADREPKGMKEGSRKEERLDAKQVKGISPTGKGVAPKGNPFAKAAPVGLKCGGPVKKMATGGAVKKGSRGC